MLGGAVAYGAATGAQKSSCSIKTWKNMEDLFSQPRAPGGLANMTYLVVCFGYSDNPQIFTQTGSLETSFFSSITSGLCTGEVAILEQ